MEKIVRLRTLYDAWSVCQQCQFLCHDRKHVVFGYGQFEKKPLATRINGQAHLVGLGAQILVVGEAPGANEDEQGVPFVGKSGMLLNQLLGAVSVREEVKEKLAELAAAKSDDLQQRHNYALRDLLCEEFFFTNVIACHPPENRDPTPGEIAACRTRLLEILYIVDPVVIIGVGRIAVESLIGRKVSITQVRGEMFDVPVKGRLLNPVKYPLIATLHPSYLMRKNDWRQENGDGAKTFRDFLKAVKIVDDFNFRNYGITPPKRPDERGRD